MEELLKEGTLTEDEPPGTSPRPARSWRVAVIANIKGESVLPASSPADAGAEFDKKETIQAIQAAIESDGHSTVFIPANANLPFALREFCPDICFNIAEGEGGDGREAQVPALLEMMHIPYTASRVEANAIGLDKTMTKRIWRQQGLPTAVFQEFATGNEPIDPELSYPLFVKPAREGTGMGMGADSVVHNDDQLRSRVRWVIDTYNQPALVEDFLPGREFTIGVVGRPDASLYSRRSELYGSDGFIHFPTLEIDNHRSVTPGVYGHTAKTLHEGDDGVPGFLCPAPVDARTTEMYHDLAVRAHMALNTVDVSRVDIRLDSQGNPRLLEVNTLPGLTPGFSDLCVIANAYGMTYEDLILEILYLGASRYGMLPARGSQPRRLEHRVGLRIERRVHMPQMINMMPFGHTAMLE